MDRNIGRVGGAKELPAVSNRSKSGSLSVSDEWRKRGEGGGEGGYRAVWQEPYLELLPVVQIKSARPVWGAAGMGLLWQ